MSEHTVMAEYKTGDGWSFVCTWGN